jgi:signal transduction histidine kinase
MSDRPMRWRPTVGLVLLLTHAIILLLPLGGIGVLRIYESVLVRQTESALIAQSAFVAADYRATLTRIAPQQIHNNAFGNQLGGRWRSRSEDVWRPRPAVLDLATSVALPEEPPAAVIAGQADEHSYLVGRALEPILRDSQRVTLAGIRIVDMNGIVVASTGSDQNADISNRIEVRRALEGEPMSVLRRRNSTTPTSPLWSISRNASLRVHVVTPIVVGDRVVAAALFMRTPASITEAMYGKRRELIVAGVVLSLALVTVAMFTATMIRRPIRDLVKQARQVVSGQRREVTALQNPGTKEVGELSVAMAQLATSLEQRASYIRDLANHVSHEFKAPVTSMRGAVELLREHHQSMSEQDRQRFLDNLDHDAARLQRLVSALFDLAKANVAAPISGQSCVADSVVRNVMASSPLNSQIHTQNNLLRAHMGEETLRSIVDSMFTNAQQNGATNVDIRLSPSADKSMLLVTIADNGNGVSAADQERIFAPFFTTRKDQGGSGLGLAIVSALLRAHKGSIRLLPSSEGAKFEIAVPIFETNDCP